MPCTVHKSRWHLEHHGLVVALFMSVFTITCCATDAGCSIRVPDQASAKYTTVVSGVDAPAGPRSFTHGDNVTYRCIMNHWFAGPPASAVKTCVCSPTENCVPIPQPCVLRSPAVCKLLVSSSSTTKYSAWIADNQVSGNRSLSHGETVVYRCIAGHSFKTGKNVTACTCNQTSTCKTPEPCVKDGTTTLATPTTPSVPSTVDQMQQKAIGIVVGILCVCSVLLTSFYGVCWLRRTSQTDLAQKSGGYPGSSLTIKSAMTAPSRMSTLTVPSRRGVSATTMEETEESEASSI